MWKSLEQFEVDCGLGFFTSLVSSDMDGMGYAVGTGVATALKVVQRHNTAQGFFYLSSI